MTLFRHRMTGPGSAGDVWVCTLHSEGAASIDAAHLAWATFVDNLLTPNLVSWWTPKTKVTEIITDQLDPLSWRNVAQLTGTVDYTGTSAGAAPSPRACLVLGLRTNLPTRGGRGRMFLPSPSGTHYADTGKFIGAETNTLAADAAAALQHMTGTVSPVIAHRTTKQFTPISRVTVGDIPGTQRRRTNKDVQNYATGLV